jgi:predicted DNA-binding protein
MHVGRHKLWDITFGIRWAAAWVERLNAVAKASGDDAGTIVRRVAEREIRRLEKKFGLAPKEDKENGK